MPSKKNNKKKTAAQKAAAAAAAAENGNGSDPQTNNVNGDGSDKSDDDAPPPLAPVDPEVEGERLKEQGNDAFKAKRYGEAVDLYTKAISEYNSFSWMIGCGVWRIGTSVA
ncbi:hypothetical protein PENSPDRAFT_147355 [Peniophora sp. CONT]|nr:hypothetical protein PENSPDRAFT_147355 [Peniophora sp. CONT]